VRPPVDNGLGANAFTPVSILDPGPDGIPATFDDQHLTVYQQSPATFGNDHYVLTNASGLRTLNAGFLREVGTEWREFRVHASLRQRRPGARQIHVMLCLRMIPE